MTVWGHDVEFEESLRARARGDACHQVYPISLPVILPPG
jgi:hypothetical protein